MRNYLNKIIILSLSMLLVACGQTTTSQSTSVEENSSISFSSVNESIDDSTVESSVHAHDIVIDEAVPAGCNGGLTQGQHCGTCGEIIVPQQVLPPQHNTYIKQIYTEPIDGIQKPALFYCHDCDYCVIRSIEPSDINNMPILELNGDMSGISKENEVEINTIYTDCNQTIESAAEIKWQGSSSLGFDKKNYNITFLKSNGKKNKLLLNEDWGEQSKYCLKANYIDYSQARNVVSGRIYAQIAKNRGLDDEINNLPNAGVVDGFPILIYENGNYQGIYTLNIPKNKWMFGMDDETLHQAAFMTDDHGKSCCLDEPISEDFSNGWDVEYCSTEDTDEGIEWARESMNNLINFLATATNDEFKGDIGDYVIQGRTYDAFIFTTFICAADNFGKNIIWLTYDGTTWFPSVYDLDGTWGLVWDGKSYYTSSTFTPDVVVKQYNCNRLWKRLYETNFVKFKARYKALRRNILTIENITNQFESFMNQIPEVLRQADMKKWPNIPSTDTNNLDQILIWTAERFAIFDEFYGFEH